MEHPCSIHTLDARLPEGDACIRGCLQAPDHALKRRMQAASLESATLNGDRVSTATPLLIMSFKTHQLPMDRDT